MLGLLVVATGSCEWRLGGLAAVGVGVHVLVCRWGVAALTHEPVIRSGNPSDLHDELRFVDEDSQKQSQALR